MINALSQTQTQTTKINLSPAQIQAMKLLELPLCELRQRVDEELQSNPALEEGQDPNERLDDDLDYASGMDSSIDSKDAYSDYDPDNPDYGSHDDHDIIASNGSSRMREEIPISMGISFNEYLKKQIYETRMNKADRHIAKFVVGNIDERGYLRRTVEELVDDIQFKENIVVTDEKMQEIVDQVKKFDPIGVGSYSLQECLLTQLAHKKPTPAVQCAQTILTHHFDAFVAHKYEKIKLRLQLTDAEMIAAKDVIVHLNPSPSNAWTGTQNQQQRSYIIPDFIVEREDERLIVSLNNSEVPPVHVSLSYTQILKEQDKKTPTQKEANKEIKKYVDTASNFIEAIAQRNETLLRVMKTLVALQREFFLEGDYMYLRPITQEDVAVKSGYDISTISRATKEKYVQTEFGIIPLKSLFSNATINNKGEVIATRGVKETLREIVSQEDKSQPLNDDQLREELIKAGFKISRRTVAKYRDLLGIEKANLRRQ